MESLAPVDHREERQHGGAAVDHRLELDERAGGQRRRDDRDEQRVGGLEHALGDQRDARRAVEEHVVVLAS